MLKISVLGAGGFGCAMACVYRNLGYSVTLWAYTRDQAKEIQQNQENKHYLPGIKISPEIFITSNISDVLDSDVVLVVVPSFAVKSTISLLKNKISKNSVIVCLSKGIEEQTLKLFSQIIEETLPNSRYAILSGPSHAEEIAKDITTALIVSSPDNSVSKYIQSVLSAPHIRIYVNNDLIGVQVGGALKNIIALATGICDGMNLGDNTKAALMTRGLKEISELGITMGAQKETFSGLSGIGDLIVTCTSLHSRNKKAGTLIGKGLAVKEAIAQVGMTVEGYVCSKCAYNLCKKHNIDLPIINEVYYILYDNKNPKQALKDLLQRPYKYESESNI